MLRSFFAIILLFVCNVSCAEEYCCEIVPGYLPPAAPDCGLFVDADFLWWNACENDLDYVQKGIGAAEIQGKLKFAYYDWNPGFRIAGGYRWNCDGWDARIVYTYYETDNHDQTINTDEDASLDPFLLHPIAIPPAFDPDQAAASVDLDYETFDLLLSRSFCVSPTLIMRPYFGFRALWLNKDFNAFYKEESVVRKIDWCSDIDGYGLHGGIDCNINLTGICPGLGLNGIFAASILAARSDVHHLQAGDISTYIDVREKQCFALPGYHLGVNLSRDFSCENAYVVLSVGYELNIWEGLPQIRRYTQDEDDSGLITARSASASNGKLLLHGLTVRGEVFF